MHAMHVKIDTQMTLLSINYQNGISDFDLILVILYISNIKTVGFSSKYIKVTSIYINGLDYKYQ